MVLGEHSRFTFDFPKKADSFFYWAFDGNLGVRFFFVISGFLITYLLLKEHVQTGALSLRNFYARRALRILPVYFAFLAVIFVLQILTPSRQLGITWLGNLTFTSNFVPCNSTTTVHLWTLAVEEQFYVFWPLILCLAGLQNTRRILFLLAVPVFVSPICKTISYTGYTVLLPAALDPLFQRYSSLYYFDSLAIGCMAAVLFVKYNREILTLLSRFGGVIAMVGAALVLVPDILSKLYLARGFIAIAGSTVQAVGLAMLLLQSILFPRFFKPLNWALVRQIGVLSYSIYIWHGIFWANPHRYGLPHVWFLSFYGWLAAVFPVAMISYYCLERPVTNLRARLRA